MKRTIRDCTGAVIRKHDVIVYPVRMGSDMWMNMAYVEEIDEWGHLKVRAKMNAWGCRFASWPTVIYCNDRTTVVPDSNEGVQDFLINLMVEGKTEALKPIRAEFPKLLRSHR